MLGFVTAVQRVFVSSLFFWLAGLPLVLLMGCGAFSSGKSEVQKFADHQQALGQTIVAAGGKAELREQSMAGFTVYGWSIDLKGAKVTDALLDRIIEMAVVHPILELNLCKTAITDNQLGKLDKGRIFVKLVNLDLSDTKITDAGLDQINSVVALTNLNLKGSSATKEGAERLGNRKIANPQTPPPFKKQPEVTI